MRRHDCRRAVLGGRGAARDIVAQKREQYRRVLVPPQERGFHPEAWLALVDSPNVTQSDFGRLEDLFDARSRLYDATTRARRDDGPPRTDASSRFGKNQKNTSPAFFWGSSENHPLQKPPISPIVYASQRTSPVPETPDRRT